MKKLFLALVAASTLYLTGCSSCLGTTSTPGEAAPQAEASNDPEQTVNVLDSLLKAGNGEQFYAILANVPEIMMEASDTTELQNYGMVLHHFFVAHQDEIDRLVASSSDPLVQEVLPGLVSSFSNDSTLQTFIHTLPAFTNSVSPATDMVGN